MISPHTIFKIWSADEVAECLEGVDDELYKKLWSIVIPRRKRDFDYSEVHDDFSYRCLARSWDKLTIGEQRRLNELAAKSIR